MKPLILATIIAAMLAGCAGPTTLKSPCAGGTGSPCDRTPLSTGAMT